MKPPIVFQFDKIVEICPKKNPVTMREICFRSLPNAHFLPEAEFLLRRCSDLDFKTILIAHENEILVKESLMTLKSCSMFHDILIIDEYISQCNDPELYAKLYIMEHYGTNVIFAESLDPDILNYLNGNALQ